MRVFKLKFYYVFLVKLIVNNVKTLKNVLNAKMGIKLINKDFVRKKEMMNVIGVVMTVLKTIEILIRVQFVIILEN